MVCCVETTHPAPHQHDQLLVNSSDDFAVWANTYKRVYGTTTESPSFDLDGDDEIRGSTESEERHADSSEKWESPQADREREFECGRRLITVENPGSP